MSPTRQRETRHSRRANVSTGTAENARFAPPPPARGDAIQVLVRPIAEGVEPPPWMAQWLDGDERARAARFTNDTDRWRFVEAHALLRHVLASHLGTEPASIAFELSDHGKPEHVGPASTHAVSFNLSHTAGMVVLALAGDGRRIGVDVERSGPRADALNIARSRFTQRESAYIEALSRSERADAFVRLWTRKEALHKADGRGLSLPLNTFDVLDDRCGDWLVTDLALRTGHLGAVAYEARDGPLAIETHVV